VRVLHVITGLGQGGAETMLAKLVEALPGITHVVAPLTGDLALRARIEAAGGQVMPLGMRGPRGLPAAVLRLAALIRRVRPDVIQSWLYHADLAATLARAAALSRAPLAWSLRCSDMDLARYAATTRLVVRALARLSAVAAVIASNSEAGLAWHCRLGYRPRRTIVIPNGFETDRFRPDPQARAPLLALAGWPQDAVIVGLVARVDPMKDHAGFLAALARTPPALHAMLVGRGTEALAIPPALAGRVLALGPREDIAALTAGFDIACLASRFGEGFPNVLGEAMACAVPCVTTDVGDAAAIVGAAGVIVPPGDPAALAEALTRLATDPERRRALGAAGRARVLAEYALPAVAARYAALWRGLAGG
jgi:glycosyltransferase involved in cell wall biosynthesis